MRGAVDRPRRRDSDLVSQNTMLKMASKVNCTVVVVGDAKVGKSAVIHRLTDNVFLEKYTPTSFDKRVSVQEVDKHHVEFVIWDTSGSPAYDSVRSLAYNEADVFLICYKISDPISLYNVKHKWMPEIRQHRLDAPVILCGCQADTRSDPEVIALLCKTGRTPVSSEQALAICCEVGAANYVETSADCPLGLGGEIVEAFELCALAALKNTPVNTNTSSSHGSASGKRRPTHQVSFGSASDFNTTSSKKSTGSAKSNNRHNVSFGSSDTESTHVGQHAQPQQPSNSLQRVILEDDDVFPGMNAPPPPIPPVSPVQHQHRRSLVQQRASFSGSASKPARNELANRPANLTSPNGSAQIRTNGLSRRASFRSPTSGQKPSIPVATPKSPLGSEVSFELKSPLSTSIPKEVMIITPATPEATKQHSTSFEIKQKAYESLKSQGSTASQGSTGSKTSTGSSVLSTNSSSGKISSSCSKDLLDPSVPDTEDPELLRQLQFVSPKAGVFRPINSSPGMVGKARNSFHAKDKEKCLVM